MNPYILIFVLCSFMAVIAALLRQLNKEREERFTLLQQYANLALRIRWSQSMNEDPLKEAMPTWDDLPPSSVQDYEGA